MLSPNQCNVSQPEDGRAHMMVGEPRDWHPGVKWSKALWINGVAAQSKAKHALCGVFRHGKNSPSDARYSRSVCL